jgi:hypothetical protein
VALGFHAGGVKGSSPVIERSKYHRFRTVAKQPIGAGWLMGEPRFFQLFRQAFFGGNSEDSSAALALKNNRPARSYPCRPVD